ncbi:MAG: hypothetical protein ACI8WB_002251 [Phenylobacterium sp.]|jgi:hypothetical protein
MKLHDFSDKKTMMFLPALTILSLVAFSSATRADEFLHFPDAAISGYNNKHLSNKTVEQCKTACSIESGFFCRSFDYYKHSNGCDLSVKSGQSVGGLKTNYSNDPYDHYARNITVDSIAWSNTAGWDDPGTYTTIQTPDINGDGAADICGRSPEGIRCHLSLSQKNQGAAWGEEIKGPTWIGAWSRDEYASTIKFVDINGDQKDDLCGRAAKGIVCHISNGLGFGGEILGPIWSNSTGWAVPYHYGTIGYPDINNDGKADICARSVSGIQCHLSTGNGFSQNIIRGPNWYGSGSWSKPEYYSTIRYPDINADGYDDVCALLIRGIVCHLNQNGSSFSSTLTLGPVWIGAWTRHKYYSTIEFPDINGDGAADVCGRSARGILCQLSTGTGFGKLIDGPLWSDATLWDQAKYYETIQYVDINSDEKIDICARYAVGVRCFLSHGEGFGNTNVGGPAWTGTSAWGLERYYASIRFADVNNDGLMDTLARGTVGVSTVIRWPTEQEAAFNNSGTKISLGAIGAYGTIKAYVSTPPVQQGNNVIIGGTGSFITFDSPYSFTNALKLHDVELVAHNQTKGAAVYYDVVSDSVSLPLPSLGGLEQLVNNVGYLDNVSLQVIAGNRFEEEEIPLLPYRPYLLFGYDASGGAVPNNLDWNTINNAVVIDPTDPSIFFNSSMSYFDDLAGKFGAEIELLDVGAGISYNGMIPFHPATTWDYSDGGLNTAQMHSFDGHVYIKGDMKIGPVSLSGPVVVKIDPNDADAPVVFGGNIKLQGSPIKNMDWIGIDFGNTSIVGHIGEMGLSTQICYVAKPSSSDSLLFDAKNVFKASKVAGCFSSVLADNFLTAQGNMTIPGIGYSVANATMMAKLDKIDLAGEVKVVGQTFQVNGIISRSGLDLSGTSSISVNAGVAKVTGTVTLALTQDQITARLSGSASLSYVDKVCGWVGGFPPFSWACDYITKWGTSISVNQNISLPGGTITVNGIPIKVL